MVGRNVKWGLCSPVPRLASETLPGQCMESGLERGALALSLAHRNWMGFAH